MASQPPPPPPPPPHGQNPRPPGGLPDGNYDIFIIPPHSAGSGFLYLPSLQPNRNSFLAGVAATLLAVGLWTLIVPAVQQWVSTVSSGGGGVGVFLLAIAIGVACWAWGKTQGEGSANPRSNNGTSGSGANNSWQSAGGPSPNAFPRAGSAPPPPPPPPGSHGPQPEPQPQPQPKPRANPSGTSAWEKAREETRKREEERKRAEELKKRREAREEAERAAKAKAEKEKWEQARAREREQREREARERIARERLAREKEKEQEKERAQTKAQSAPSKGPTSPSKRYEKPTAFSAPSEDNYSYRPYDTPKRATHKSAASSVSGFSEDSSAPSHTTARTTPPPSQRRPYSTQDPDKIQIKGVYLFSDSSPTKPVSQLVSNQGPVTDGLILHIKTEGLFIDDDIRGVPQREWDVKAWTLKLVEDGMAKTQYGSGLHIFRATTRDTENKKYTFVLDETEAWKVAIGLQRLRKGSQVRSLGMNGMKDGEVKGLLTSLGYV